MMTSALRTLIDQRHPLVAPSIYDGISATVVRDLGFEAAYIGSYATGATRYGIPDLGYLGLEDMADQVRRLAPVVQVPLIVDGEGGWGNPLQTARSVAVIERAGAAAIHIEDHVYDKHLVGSPVVLPVQDAVDKIKAAVDARVNDSFMIIARTDAAGSEGSSGAVDRMLAYQDAGADGLFIASAHDDGSFAKLKPHARVPLIASDFSDYTAAQHAEQGIDVVIYYALAHVAAESEIRKAYSALLDESSERLPAENYKSFSEFDRFLGIEPLRDAARRYGLIAGDRL